MGSLTQFSHFTVDLHFPKLISTLLQKRPSQNTLQKARQLHAMLLTATPKSDNPFLYNNLLNLYLKQNSSISACNLFDTMHTRNTISYNTLISSYSKSSRHAHISFVLFNDMGWYGMSPNASTFASISHAASTIGHSFIGQCVHCKAVVTGFYSNLCVQTSILGMYSDYGEFKDVERVFVEMDARDSVAWNSLIYSSVNGGRVKKGLILLNNMIKEGILPDQCTFSIVLNACAKVNDLRCGRMLHAHILKLEMQADNVLQNALLDMYSKCGDLFTAESVFGRIKNPDLVSWNCMISAFSDIDASDKAIDAFLKLKYFSKPDDYTFASIVIATAPFPCIYYGKPLHAEIVKTGYQCSLYVCGTLISMYFLNSDPSAAINIFNSIFNKDVVLWTEMILGHSRIGELETAIKYFKLMLQEGYNIDSFSISIALSSSADIAALRQGETIQSLSIKSGYEENMCICGSLIDMYAKNGNMDGACLIFQKIKKPDLKCWNSMIGGYGNHGHADRAFELVSKMKKEGIEPDHVTYLSLLSACVHKGYVERGRYYWHNMISDGITPTLKHYTCMVSLLSRGRLLDEAKQMILQSHYSEKFTELWRILLSACVGFRNLETGVYAAEHVLELEPDDSPTHVMLYNLYASLGKWDNAAGIRKKVRGLMLEKDPGLSWTELNGCVHVFSADDEIHQEVSNCRKELFRLSDNLKRQNFFEMVEIVEFCD